jgi:ribosomal protein S6--L-glutamate ligase
MNLYFMLAFARNAYNPNPVLVELFEILRRNCDVEIGVASELILDSARLTDRADLYVLKSHSALWLSLAGIVHQQGGRLLNPYPSCQLVHNKIVAQRRLEAAHIPTPRSWVTGDLRLLRAVAQEWPVILKPYVGGRGSGVTLLRNDHDLSAVPVPNEPVLVQEYIAGDELKLYGIGQEVFGVRKVITSAGPVRVPTPVSDAVRAIAQRCGTLFGLTFYGVDVIDGAQGPAVIDVNYFPSYKGVPGAAQLLARGIMNYAAATPPAPALPQTPRREIARRRSREQSALEPKAPTLACGRRHHLRRHRAREVIELAKMRRTRQAGAIPCDINSIAHSGSRASRRSVDTEPPAARR